MAHTNEVTPQTADTASELEELLLKAQLLANKLVANDQLKVLKKDDLNIDFQIMKIRHIVTDYEKDIRDAMAVTF